MKRNFILIVGIILLTACGAVSAGNLRTPSPIQAINQPVPAPPTAANLPAPTYSIPSPCNLPPITVPVMPSVIPGYTELDPATGLHMTGKPLAVDLQTYRLKVSGLVEKPMEWDFEELRCLPKVTIKASLECPGFFVDVTTWSGVPIATLLEKAGVKKTATQIVMISADGYQTYVSLKDALNERNFLAYEWMGQPVPVLHGFPVRAIFPQLEGSKWAKWLVEIKVE
jgi:DMSO/TMAO reductase YedYZ molybdopterin-dependent catalytic subunit